MQEEIASNPLQQKKDSPDEIETKKNSNITKYIILGIGICLILISIGIGVYLLGKGSSEPESTSESTNGNLKNDTNTDETEKLAENMVFKKETTPLPSWVSNDPEMSKKGPWFDFLSIAYSEDGLNFSNEKQFLEHAGVAHLMQDSSGMLIATFQYFSFMNKNMFDVIAYSTSDDEGGTWSSVKPVTITDLGEGANPCDPTLVELEDGKLRLYFTYQQRGEEYPQLFSAIGDSIDSEFLSEGQQLLTDEIILDPAVVYFKGKWHHYTVKHGTEFDAEPSANLVSVHSVSDDGLAFKLVDEIKLDMQFLGDVIIDEGGLRFYGGQKSAFSEDGYTWTLEDGMRFDGADPGVVKLSDGSYIAIYTKVNPK
jgi:hypothetical protein